MKRIIQFALLALLLAPTFSHAVTCCTNGGAITSPNVDKDSTGKLVLRMLAVDATGTVITPTAAGQTMTVAGTVTTNQGAAGAAGWPVIITPTVNIDPKGTSVVAFTASRYVWAASTAFQATTAGMFVNASSAAGASCNDCKMYWQANALGYWDMGASASIPSTLGATTGFTISANVTPLLENSFLDGEGIYVKGQTGTVQFTVTVKKRQQ